VSDLAECGRDTVTFASVPNANSSFTGGICLRECCSVPRLTVYFLCLSGQRRSISTSTNSDFAGIGEPISVTIYSLEYGEEIHQKICVGPQDMQEFVVQVLERILLLNS
jgi:hypothetical protein